MRSISSGLSWFSSGWLALAALVIFAAFMILVLPGQAQKAQETSGGAGSPDTSFFYSPSDLYRMAEAYGEQGRAAYIQARFTFDLIFPLVYGFFLIASIGWVAAQISPEDSHWRFANLVPLAGVLFDYLENLSASLVMLRYPSQTPLFDLLTPVFTLLKWMCIGSSFFLLLTGLLVLAQQKIISRKLI
jgi:hypothetical protein